MRGKIKFLAIGLLASVVMNSQVFAVTYQPNNDVNIQKDNIESLEEFYDEKDVDKVLEIYTLNDATEEEMKKYDMNDDGIIDSADAAIVLNLIKY